MPETSNRETPGTVREGRLRSANGGIGERLRRSLVTPVSLVVLGSVLLAILELGARHITTSSSDPGLARVVRDFPHLEERLAHGFRFIPNDKIGYCLRPDYRLTVDGQTTTHTSLGVRGPREVAAKPAGILHVACIGASTTYGVGVVSDEATYPAQLERELVRSGLGNVRVFNLGVGGYTTREVLLNLERYADTLSPDVVVVQCAINDVFPRLHEGFSCDYRHFRRPLQLPRTDMGRTVFYRSYLVLLAGYELGFIAPLTLQDRTQAPLPGPERAGRWIDANGTACYEANLRRIIRSAQAMGATPVLLTQAYLVHPDFMPSDDASLELENLIRLGLDQHNDIVRQLAYRNGLVLCDIDKEIDRLRRHFTDPIHMTETGNAAKARLARTAVIKAIEVRREGSALAR